MEGDIVKKAGIDKGHAEIWHSREMHIAVYLKFININL